MVAHRTTIREQEPQVLVVLVVVGKVVITHQQKAVLEQQILVAVEAVALT